MGRQGTSCKQEECESVPAVTQGCLRQTHSQLKAFYTQQAKRMLKAEGNQFHSPANQTNSWSCPPTHSSLQTYVTGQIMGSQTTESAATHTLDGGEPCGGMMIGL